MSHVTFEPNHPRTHSRTSSSTSNPVSRLLGAATRTLGIGRGTGWAPVSREPEDDDIPLSQAGHGVVSLDDDMEDAEATYGPGRMRPARGAGSRKPAFYNAMHYRFLGGVLLVIILYVLYRTLHPATPKRRAQVDADSAFGVGLGCDDGIYYYTTSKVNFTSTNSTFLDIPIEDASFKINIIGQVATGTIILSWDDSLNDTALMEITIHAREPVFDFGVQLGGSSGGLLLNVYDEANVDTNCVQYDLVIHLPYALQKLAFDIGSLSHIKFQKNHSLPHAHVLDSLDVIMTDNRTASMLILSDDFQAQTTDISVAAGKVVGTLPILERVTLNTEPDASTAMDMYPSDLATSDAHLTTYSGTAPFQLSYYNPSTSKYIDRCLTVRHSSQGDMDLDYSSKSEGSGLRGKVEYKSKGNAAIIDMAPGGVVGGGGCDTMHVDCGGDLRMMF